MVIALGIFSISSLGTALYGTGASGSIASAAAAKTVVKLKKNMYVGDKFVYKAPLSSITFKSASSSKKSVATVKKTSKKVTITAKKKGTSVITIKTNKKTVYKYTVVVKKKSTTWKAFSPYNNLDESTSRYSSGIMFEVVNTSGVFATEAMVEYKLYGTSGAVVSTGSYKLTELLPNAKIHFFGSAGSLTEKVKSGKITKITLNQDENAAKYKYTNQNSKITITELERDDYSIKLSIKNTHTEGVSGVGELIYYSDSAGKYPIGMSTINLYTNAGGSNTLSVAPTKGYKSYKVFKRAYTSKYTG